MEELREIAPGLLKVEKKNPFKVPENYFSGLPQDIQKAISEKKPAFSLGDWLLHFSLQPKYSLAVAVFLIISIGGYYYFSHFQGESDPLSNLAFEEIENYIEYNIEEFEEVLIDNVLASADLDDLIEEEQIDLNDEDIENYLMNEFDNQLLEEALL